MVPVICRYRILILRQEWIMTDGWDLHPKRPFNKNRFHGSWRMFRDYGGGLMTDWGVHLIDMGLWAMDVDYAPISVRSMGGNFANAGSCSGNARYAECSL